MAGRRLAVFGARSDPQVAHVSERARAQGHDVIAVPPEHWTGSGEEHHSVRIGPHAPPSIQFGDAELLTADAAWVRHLVSPFARFDPDPSHGPLDPRSVWVEALQARERASTSLCAVDALVARGAVVINVPAAGLGVQNKPTQLMLLRGAGARVPETLITDDPAAARAFAKGRTVVFKPVVGGAVAKRFDHSTDEALDLIERAPVIFQVYVKGVDVRVTLVDDHVVSAAEVETPRGAADTRADPRRAADAVIREVALPEPVRQGVLTARRALGMRFAGIDVRLDPNAPDDYAILEVNPSPTFLAVEQKLGHPITDALLRALTGT